MGVGLDLCLRKKIGGGGQSETGVVVLATSAAGVEEPVSWVVL